MSARTAVTSLPREHTGDRQFDAIQANGQRIAYRLEAFPLLNGVLIVGVKDATQAGGVTDGVTVPMNQAVEFFHGLGRVPIGFIVVDVQDNPVVLERDQAGLTKGLEKTHIRLYFDPLSHNHGGANANAMQGNARVKFLVF